MIGVLWAFTVGIFGLSIALFLGGIKVSYDHEKVKAISTVMKILMEPGLKAPRRYLEAWLTLHEIRTKMMEGEVHPIFAEALAPFAPMSGGIEE